MGREWQWEREREEIMAGGKFWESTVGLEKLVSENLCTVALMSHKKKEKYPGFSTLTLSIWIPLPGIL